MARLRSTHESLELTPAPVVAAGAGLGSGSPSATVVGMDEWGTLTLVVGTSPAAGTLATVTFQNAYSVQAPAVVISAVDSATATVGGFYASVTKTAITVGTHGTPAGTMKVNYAVIGGA
jgi:hypothetical protein